MKISLLGGALLALLGSVLDARAEVQISPPAPAANEPPAIQQTPPPSTFLLFGGLPPAAFPPSAVPLPDPGGLARSARRSAECLRLLRDNRVFCSGERAVPLRRGGHD